MEALMRNEDKLEFNNSQNTTPIFPKIESVTTHCKLAQFFVSNITRQKTWVVEGTHTQAQK